MARRPGASGLGAWNGKVQNLGGGGLAGSVGAVTAATNAGYVGSSTDTGHTTAENPNFAVIQASHTLNYGKLDDFLIESLRQQYRWALDLARTYYGTPATRNYWNGCSTGGRQGLSLALNHGADFDGFLVGAPANYNSRLQITTLWPWWVNKDVADNSVTPAKFAAANASAVAACDAIDGVVDGVLGEPRACTFDARANICGSPGAPATNCLTTNEAQAINMMWDGPRNDQGTRIWYPFERGAAPSVSSTATCGNLGSQCWAHADTTFDWHPLPLSQFDDETQLATRLVAPYSDITSTALDPVRNRGGKILMYHGGADPLIPHRQSIHYYNDTLDRFGGLDAVKPWFRFFVAPGMGHCGGGVGPQPQNLFERMVEWVETGNCAGQHPRHQRQQRRRHAQPAAVPLAADRALQRHGRPERCGELHLRRQRRDAHSVLSRHRRPLPERNVDRARAHGPAKSCNLQPEPAKRREVTR